jgi:hypothetical protein
MVVTLEKLKKERKAKKINSSLNNKYIKSKNESENEICKCKYIGN